MAKVMVLINRSTVRRNPNAGCTDYHEPTGSTATLKISGLFAMSMAIALEKKFNARLTEYTLVGGAGRNGEFILAPDTDIDALRAFLQKEHGMRGVTVSVQNHFQEIHSITPEPELLFEYLDPEFDCQNCGHTLKVSELQDSNCGDPDCDCDLNHDRLCPVCEEEACSEVKWEDPKKALKGWREPA